MLLMLLLSNEYFMSHVHEHYKGIRPPAPLFFFWGGGRLGEGEEGAGRVFTPSKRQRCSHDFDQIPICI